MTDSISDFKAELEDLRFANSYTRMACLLNLRDHPEFYEMLGVWWSGCYNIADHAQDVSDVLSAKRWPITDAMTQDEREALAALPDKVQVYRGAYAVNARGFSWSLSRDIASEFPRLNRYQRDGEQPILVVGTVH
jgi:hypothetical protein